MNTISDYAFSIQQGREELLPDLWEAVRGLVAWFAQKFYIPRKELCTQRGVELDDLIQCGYFALIRCLKAFAPDKGEFSSLLAHYLRSEFNKALGRTARQRGDLLNHCLSLDADLDADEPDSNSLYDLIPDGRDYTGPVEHRIFVQQLHDELEKAIASLPCAEAATIRAEYWEGLSPEEIAERRSQPVQMVRNQKQRALRQLRRRTKELEQYLDRYTPFYNNTGLRAYENRGMSSVEYNVLLRERKEREYDSLCSEG